MGKIRQRKGSTVKYTYPDKPIMYGELLDRERIIGTGTKHYRVFFDKVKWDNGHISYRLVYYYRDRLKKTAWVFGQRPADFSARIWRGLFAHMERSRILNPSKALKHPRK